MNQNESKYYVVAFKNFTRNSWCVSSEAVKIIHCDFSHCFAGRRINFKLESEKRGAYSADSSEMSEQHEPISIPVTVEMNAKTNAEAERLKLVSGVSCNPADVLKGQQRTTEEE